MGRNKSGFTIVELLIVIVVIAILAAITAITFNGIRARATDSARGAIASRMRTSLENFATLNDRYPTHSEITGPSGAALLGLKYEDTMPSGPGSEIEVGFDADSTVKGLRYLATTGPNFSGTGCDGSSICRYYRISYWSATKNTAVVFENSK